MHCSYLGCSLVGTGNINGMQIIPYNRDKEIPSRSQQGVDRGSIINTVQDVVNVS